jgi:hypothetical protein
LDLRLYETEDGNAVIAPWNPAIQPGTEVVAEGSIHGVLSVPVGTSTDERTTAVGRAAALVPVEP